MTDDVADLESAALANGFLQATAENRLADIDEDSAYAMAAAAAADPGITKGIFGDSAVPTRASAEFLFGNMMSDWFAAVFTRMREDNQAHDVEAKEAGEQTVRNSVYRYSGLSPEELGRVEFDAENGDASAMLALKERFYLG